MMEQKLVYIYITGVMILIPGVMIPFITARGPPLEVFFTTSRKHQGRFLNHHILSPVSGRLHSGSWFDTVSQWTTCRKPKEIWTCLVMFTEEEWREKMLKQLIQSVNWMVDVCFVFF